MATYDNNQGGASYSGAQINPGATASQGYAAQPAPYLQAGSHNLTDPLRNFKFLVTINHDPGNSVGGQLSQGIGFMSVSGLAATTESIPYREGGMNTTVHQLPGQTSFSPITLQRGVTVGGNSKGAWTWFRQLFDVVGGQGTGPGNHPAGNQFRCNVDIDVLDHPITNMEESDGGLITPVKLRVHVLNAWITSFSLSDLNAGDNAVMVEQMTLVHEGFMVAYASGAPYSTAPRINGVVEQAAAF
jgi:phage tail-like protein